MMFLISKYGRDLFNLDGIGDQLDLNKFSKTFFKNNSTTADVSVDSNSNVVAKTGIEYNFELAKPWKKYNSYFLLWKELRKLYGHEFANKTIEEQVTGIYYINDVTDVALPYSYHPDTTILTNHDNFITMSDFFDKYSEINKTILSDREEVDLRKESVSVWDGTRYVKVLCVLRHKSHADLLCIETTNGKISFVTDDHPVITKENPDGVRADTIKVGDELVESMSTYEENLFEISENEKYKEFSSKHDLTIPKNWTSFSTDEKRKLFAKFFDHYATCDKISGKFLCRSKTFKEIQFLSILADMVGCLNCKTSFNSELSHDYTTVFDLRFNIYDIDNILFYSRKKDKYKNIGQSCNSTSESDKLPTVCKITKVPFKYGLVYDIQTETGRFSSGGLYCHNCFNYSTFDIALSGLRGISKRMNITRPKSFETFIRQVEQFTVYAANSTLGATGFADLFIVGAHYVDKIIETGYDGHKKISDIKVYLSEIIKSLIYTFNWEFRKQF